MAAYLNRTLSMMTGNGHNNSANGFDPNALTLHSPPNDTSPLQIFVRAKKKINDIFGEIEDYVVETTVFIDGELQYNRDPECLLAANLSFLLQTLQRTASSLIRLKMSGLVAMFTRWPASEKCWRGIT